MLTTTKSKEIMRCDCGDEHCKDCCNAGEYFQTLESQKEVFHMKDNNQRIQELGKSIDEVRDNFKDLPPYEVGARLIACAVDLILFCAPNHLIAMKTILASIDMGVSEYEEDQEEVKVNQ